MTIAQIKEQLGVTGFNLSRCTTKDATGKEVPNEFLRHWDAKNRFSLVMHQDVRDKAKMYTDPKDPNASKFALKWEAKATKEQTDASGNVTNTDTAGLVYDSYILIWSANIEDSL